MKKIFGAILFCCALLFFNVSFGFAADSPTIGITSEEFCAKFNIAGEKLDSGLDCGPFLKKTETTLYDLFDVVLTDHIHLAGSINKGNGQIRTVKIFGEEDGTTHGAANLLLASAQIIMATTPELDVKARGKLLHDLGIDGETTREAKSYEEKSVIVGNKKFFGSVSEYTGFLFGVTSAE